VAEADAALKDLPPHKVRQFPDAKAFEWPAHVAAAQGAALLEGAQAFRFSPENSRCAWSRGEGPLVLMIHDWGGRRVQMTPLARTLALTNPT